MNEPVRVLLDEGVPIKLKWQFSAAFAVTTVREHGWAERSKGDLLRAAEREFDALVTVDKQMRYQQNIAARTLAVVVLEAAGTRYEDLLPLIPATEAAIRDARAGEIVIVSHAERGG